MHTSVTDDQMVWWTAAAIKLHPSRMARIFHPLALSLFTARCVKNTPVKLGKKNEQRVRTIKERIACWCRCFWLECWRLQVSIDMKLKNPLHACLSAHLKEIEKRWVESNQINDGHFGRSLAISFTRSVYTFTLTSRMHRPFLFFPLSSRVFSVEHL